MLIGFHYCKERHAVAQRQVYIGRLFSDVHVSCELMLGANSHVALACHCSQGVPADVPSEDDPPAVPPNPASPTCVIAIGSFGVDQSMWFSGSCCVICK